MLKIINSKCIEPNGDVHVQNVGLVFKMKQKTPVVSDVC